LSLDFGEMSGSELITRNVSMFTQGRVPIHLLETGLWRKNPEMVKLVREVWPKVKNIKEYYYNIAGKSADEVISLIRRFYYSRVGRGGKMIVNYDYLKPFDVSNHGSSEWAEMGHFIQKIKSLITREIPCPFWTSLQLNRSGITTNKKNDQIDDSENSFSISDRIVQQASHAFILRHKTLEELAAENNQFGNSKLICVKARHLGEDYEAEIHPVRMPDGKYHKNFIHLNIRSFHVTELGDLSQTANRTGQLQIDNPPDDSVTLD
jgi:replicative DNA helicase